MLLMGPNGTLQQIIRTKRTTTIISYTHPRPLNCSSQYSLSFCTSASVMIRTTSVLFFTRASFVANLGLSANEGSLRIFSANILNCCSREVWYTNFTTIANQAWEESNKGESAQLGSCPSQERFSPVCCSQHRSSSTHFYREIPHTARWMDERSHAAMLLVQLSGNWKQYSPIQQSEVIN